MKVFFIFLLNHDKLGKSQKGIIFFISQKTVMAISRESALMR